MSYNLYIIRNNRYYWYSSYKESYPLEILQEKLRIRDRDIQTEIRQSRSIEKK